MKAGADNFTKFPAIKYFNTVIAKEIEDIIKKAGREFIGTFTEVPDIDIDSELDKLDLEPDIKGDIKKKTLQYLEKMKKK